MCWIECYYCTCCNLDVIVIPKINAGRNGLRCRDDQLILKSIIEISRGGCSGVTVKPVNRHGIASRQGGYLHPYLRSCGVHAAFNPVSQKAASITIFSKPDITAIRTHLICSNPGLCIQLQENSIIGVCL